MELMGRFPKKMSMRGEKAKRYIDKAGSLARIPKLQNWTLKDVMVAKYYSVYQDIDSTINRLSFSKILWLQC
jgi:hypothetical protein